MTPSNILITGGAGFIGSSLAFRLLELGHRITIVDNLLTGSLRNVPQSDRCRFVKCDVNRYEDIAPVIVSSAFDFVFHYAAVVGVQRTIENPVLVLNDVSGIKNILDLSKNTGVKRVFFSSSSEVYGEPVSLPQHEDITPLNSRLPYAIVKNIGEAYCKSYFQEFGLSYTIFRFFNTYGPRQSQDFVMSRFIHAARRGEDIFIYGDGSQTRTFCFIDDNIFIATEALNRGILINSTVNIGNDVPISILDLASTICKEASSRSRICFLPPLKDGDMSRRQPDASIMKEILGREMVPLETGVRLLLNRRDED